MHYLNTIIKRNDERAATDMALARKLKEQAKTAGPDEKTATLPPPSAVCLGFLL